MSSQSQPLLSQVEISWGEGESQLVPIKTKATSQAEARVLGLLWFGGIWALGIVTIFIPIVHYFAVPACIFMGPVVGWVVYKVARSDVRVIGASTCKECAAPIEFNLSLSSLPRQMECLKCPTQYFVKLP